MFLKLHEKYQFLRLHEDNSEELKLAEEDAEYLEEISSKVYPLLDQLEYYQKSLTDVKSIPETSTIPLYEKKFEDSMRKFRRSKENDLKVLHCLGNLNLDEISKA